MDPSNTTGNESEQHESHWQPALRPNDEQHDESIATVQLEQQQQQQQQQSQSQSQPHVDQSQSDDTQRHHPRPDHDSDNESTEGRVDPAWGIKRIDSSHLLDGVQRTSSFPAPAPAPAPSAPASPAPASSTEPGDSELFDEGHSFSQTKPDDEEDDEDNLQSAHDAEHAIHQRSQSDLQPQSPPTLQESRYEEGLPLISPSADEEPISSAVDSVLTSPQQQQQQRDHQHNNQKSLAFDQDDEPENADADNAFFSQVSQSSPSASSSRPVLDRKETAEVLNSLGMPEVTPDSPPSREDPQPQTQATAQPVPEKDFASAFADEDTDDKDLAAVFGQNSTNQDNDDPWKSMLADDDEFLLDDADADDLLPDSDDELPPSTAPAPVSVPQQSRQLPRTNSNPYAPHQPSTAELSQFNPSTNNLGLNRAPSAFQQPAPSANIQNRAESYADQAKGGYKSPYDLPMDLAPKKRVQAHRVAPAVSTVPPPPRTSSMSEKQLQSPFSPSGPAFAKPASVTPAPISPQTAQGPKSQAAPSSRSSSGFFEELPMIPKTRQAAPRPPATQATPSGPPRLPPQAPPVQNNSAYAVPSQAQAQAQQPQRDSYSQFGLQPPEKLDPYHSAPLAPPQPSLSPAPPLVNSRYSPAPPAGQNGARVPSAPRYSPAPPSQATGPRYSPAPPAAAQQTNQPRYTSQPPLPFQPRTSSPLAQHRKSVDDSSDRVQRPASHHTSTSLPYNPAFAPAANTLSPPRQDPTKQEIVPPRRSQTQSPSRQAIRPGIAAKIAPPPDRPASAFGQLSPTRTVPPSTVLSPPRIVSQQRQSEELDFIRPTDGTEHDPLQRFKGSPVFSHGFGGFVVSSFPLHTPRFSAAATRPQIKASPGDVKTRPLQNVFSLPEHVAKFPGPLKGKAKKKDVLTWLTTTTSQFEQTMMSEPTKALEEKIALWKIVKVLVENDGNLETPQAVSAVCTILMPDVYALENPTSTQFNADNPSVGIYRPRSYTAKSEAVDPVAVDTLRKTLLKGKREDAVWQAVDNRLWSHALLLSSTLDKKVWKQVVSEFVKQEVKTIGANSDSLCALYEVLGGNSEESVDQLVPPSARAGLQMVSTVDAAGPTRNALDGLDRWKETICLILNNRTHEDQRALLTLARLLGDYGRTEASHICYLFARTLALPQMFGGLDDPSTMVVLLGADHRKSPSTFHLDTDSMLLTEVLEWAIAALPSSAAGSIMPHLAVYKLQRARELTDAGFKTEAQAYCDAILTGPGRNVKLSPYYHPLLIKETEELGNRLKQIPVAGASWMGKPSIEKVSGSVWNKFTSFVAGEDSDAESKGSFKDGAETGPFANISGSPTLSRNTSQSDLQNAFPASIQMTPGPAQTAAGSRYAPNGIGSARSSTDLTRGRASFESQRSPPSSSYSHEARNAYAPVQSQNAYSPGLMSPPTSSAYQPSPTYMASPDLHMPAVAEESSRQNSFASPSQRHLGESAMPVQPAFGGYTPPQIQSQFESVSGPEPPTFEQGQSDESSGYAPPEPESQGFSGYAPPEDSGYQPYMPEPDSDDDKPKPKPKKSFMDDDDDDYPRMGRPPTSAPRQPSDDASEAARKKANDEAADAAFRAAAEADAAAAASKNSKGSGSWLGGWFGSKRSDSLDSTSSNKDKAVHRVHLGESKMKLYYDKDKKKWINPDNPDAAEKKSLAPPPRSSTGSAPPRSVSTPMPPPISRSGTPMSQAIDTGSEGGDSRPGTSGQGHPSGIAMTLPPGTAASLGLGTTPPIGPPSRPTSSASAQSNGLDDLLAPSSGARKVSGRSAKGKKGRYVDVMAK